MKSCKEINELLSLYIDNELDKDTYAQVDEHLKNCKACRIEYDELVQIISCCNSFVDEDLPEKFKENLHRKLLEVGENEKKHTKESFLWNKYIKICSTIAAGLLLVVMLKGVWGNLDLGASKKTANSMAAPRESAAQMDRASAVDNNSGKNKGNNEAADIMISGSTSAQTGSNFGGNTKVQSPSSTEPVVKVYTDAAKEEAVSNYNLALAEVPKSQGSSSGYSGGSDMQVASDTSRGSTPVNPEQTQAVIEEKPVQAPVAAALMVTSTGLLTHKSTNIDIKGINLDSEIEKIKTIASTYGAKYNDTVQMSMTFSAKAAATPDTSKTLNISIPNAQFDQFVSALKAAYGTNLLEIGALSTNEVNEYLNVLKKTLDEVNNKITEVESKKTNTNQEQLANYKNEKTNIQTQIDKVLEDTKYTTVTVKVSIK